MLQKLDLLSASFAIIKKTGKIVLQTKSYHHFSFSKAPSIKKSPKVGRKLSEIVIESEADGITRTVSRRRVT